MITCICVTHERPAFMPWLLWNFQKQTWPDKELLIVDSSKRPFCSTEDNIRVIHTPGANIPRKRNIGVEEARGEYIAWFDDDDWSHPDRLSISAEQLQNADVVGPAVGYGLNLETMTVRQFSKMFHPAIVFSGVALRQETAVSFAEATPQGSDTAWLAQMSNERTIQQVRQPHLIFTLSHNDNISNPAASHDFPYDFAQLKHTLALTTADEAQLHTLRSNIYG